MNKRSSSAVFVPFAMALCFVANKSAAGDIVEYRQPFVIADKIKKEKIEPLHLSKSSIGEAMNKLEKIGYICGIPYPQEGWGRYNGILCEQFTSEEYCKVSLIVFGIADWDEKLSDEERLLMVDKKEVKYFSVLCRGGDLQPLQTNDGKPVTTREISI